jgi:transposase
MYFKFSLRSNSATGKSDSYYRLVESYRTETGRVNHRTIINVGFLEQSITPEQLNAVARRLTDMYQLKQSLFELQDPIVCNMVTELWGRIVSENRLDITLYQPNNRKVDVDSLKHSDVREVGAEWICYNTWQELNIDSVLEANGFTEQEIKFAQTQVITRAVYPASELASARWITENSAITELTGFDIEKVNKDRLYRSALKLSNIQQELQSHLSIKTNELFDIEDKIVLYDLTNTYFEGEKKNSKLAQYGRSKEKRSDAKLIVLALVVNIFGFIKHSSIHEGNLSDGQSLLKIIADLDNATKEKKPLVVLDAGIANQDNLKLLMSKGYNYLCVSRSKPKEIIYDTQRLSTLYTTRGKAELTLKTVASSTLDDYLLEVCSNQKKHTETSMYKQFEDRYVQELEKIKSSLSKKGGVKKTEKVYERIGRAKQKYPSVHKLFDLIIVEDEQTQLVTSLTWTRNELANISQEKKMGKYYLRTNLPFTEETIVWEAYNTIREIESTFKTLKTDLDLRPIYHKNDESTIAHLNLGLLAYWLVNTVRQKLKKQGVSHNWKEIVRIANTQKVITTTGTNASENTLQVRKCSEPGAKLKELQSLLKIKPRPFVKIKSVVHSPKQRQVEIQQQQMLGP